MAWGQPPRRSGSSARSRAARRAMDRPAPGAVDPPTVAPPPVLGGHGGHVPTPQEHILRGTQQLNDGSPEQAATGWGADRVGHRFTVGFTPDGRIVHLYGGAVPAGQRRIVLSK